jgi:hypothetical protein
MSRATIDAILFLASVVEIATLSAGAHGSMHLRPSRARRSFGFVAIVSAAFATGCTQLLDFDAVSKGAPGQGGPNADIACSLRYPAPIFCDDFDGAPISDKWNDVEIKNAKMLLVDNATYRSSPDSLVSEVLGITTADQVRSVVKTSFPPFTGVPAQLVIAFDVFVDVVDPKAGARIIAFALLYGDVNKFHEFVLNLNSTGAKASGIFTEYSYPDNASFEHAVFAPTKAEWLNVRIEIEVHHPDGTDNALRIYVGDAQGHETQVNSPTDVLRSPMLPALPRVELGIGWMDTTKGTSPWVVRYDNFSVDWKPY